MKKKKAKNRWWRWFVLVGVVAPLVMVTDLFWLYPSRPFGKPGKHVVIVPAGAGPALIGQMLERANVVSSGAKFSLWLRLSGAYQSIKAGRYTISGAITPRQVVAVLSGRSDDKGFRVTIREGALVTEIASALADLDLVDEQRFMNAATDSQLLKKLGIPGPTAEGFLFPDTYYFDRHTTAERVIARLWRMFQKRWHKLVPNRPIDPDVVTLASIVQAEAKVPKERSLIAGVYTNRLNKERFPANLLQADPTVAYGCNAIHQIRPVACATFAGTLKSRQLEDQSNPYNTYRHKGLPPGPINNPGTEALRAALHPADTELLYFVARPDGSHQFSKSYSAHQRAVARIRKREHQ